MLIYVLSFTSSTKKLLFLFLTWFLFLGIIQDGGQEGDHCRWRHRPLVVLPFIKYNSSCWEDQTLPTEGQIVSKYCNISKTSPFYHGGGMNLRVRPRVKYTIFEPFKVVVVEFLSKWRLNTLVKTYFCILLVKYYILNALLLFLNHSLNMVFEKGFEYSSVLSF